MRPARSMPCYLVLIIGQILGALAMLLTCIVTSLCQWRISVLVENDPQNPGKRIDGHWLSRWDGLWLTCIRQAYFPVRCDGYNSMVSLTQDLKAGRIFMCLAVGLSIIAFIISMVSMLFKHWNGDGKAGKNCLLLTAGIGYIVAGILVFIPVTWTAVNIGKKFCSPTCGENQWQEMGEALFLGWPTALFLFIAGSILCWFYSHAGTEVDLNYQPPPFQPQPNFELRPVKEDKYSTHLIHEHL